MAELEELAAYLLGDATQKTIAANNPYYNLQEAPNLVSAKLNQIALQDPNAKAGETLAWGLGTGLVSGLLGGAGDMYQNTLTDRYSHAVRGASDGADLPPGLFGSAQRARSLWSVQAGLDRQRVQDERDKEITKAVLADPELAQDSIGVLRQLGLAQGGGAPAAMPAAEAPDAITAQAVSALPTREPQEATEEDMLGIPAIQDRRAQLTQFYRKQGYTRTKAADAANKDLAGEMEADKKSYERVEEQRAKARDLLDIADTVDQVLDGGLSTGKLAGIKQLGAELGSYVGIGEETAALGQLLESKKAKLMSMNRVVGSGATSDYEAMQYIAAGPSLTKSPEANREISRRMRQLAERNRDYADFVDVVRSRGGTIQQADKLWSQYERANPLWAKDKRGALVPNTAAVNYKEFDFTGSGRKVASTKAQPSSAPTPSAAPAPDADVTGQDDEDPGVLERFAQGVEETPQAIRALFTPSTYQEAFATPEKGATTVGQTAGMLAGGVAGAKGGAALGAFGGPIGAGIGALIGGAIGTGAGYLGFNKATEAASEVAGVGTDETIVPTAEDIGDAAQVAGTGLGFGVVAKGLGSAARGTRGAVKGLRRGAQKSVQSAQQDIAGVRPADIEAAFSEGKRTYYDVDGAPAPLQSAAQYKTVVDRAVQTVADDGLFAKATNDPKTLALEFDKGVAAAKNNITQVHANAEAALKQIHSKLPPAQQKQFALVRDPKTGKGGFSPDFSNVGQAIQEIAKTDAQLAKTLTRRAATQIRKWENSSKSYGKMQELKSAYGRAAKWDTNTTSVDAAWNTIKKELYSSFSKAQQQAYQWAMNQTNPAAAGELAAANAKFAAYETLRPIIEKTASKGRGPILRGGLLAIPGNLWKRSPAARQSIFQAGERAIRPVEAVADPFLSSIDAAIGKATPGARAAGVGLLEGSKKKVENEPMVMQDEADPEMDSLVSAIIQQESGGRADVVSDAGAVGLMQILPSTAKEIAAELGVEKYDLKDPEINRLFGAHYIKKLLQQFGGDVELALTAYHSGPGRVKNLLSRAKGSKLEDIKKYLGPVGQKYASGVLSKMRTA